MKADRVKDTFQCTQRHTAIFSDSAKTLNICLVFLAGAAAIWSSRETVSHPRFGEFLEESEHTDDTACSRSLEQEAWRLWHSRGRIVGALE